MRQKKQYLGRKKTSILIVIISCVFVLTKCVGNNKTEYREEKDVFRKFAGSEACASCHKDIYDKHIHTEHFLTSSPVNDTNVLGNFEQGKNVFEFDPYTYVAMEKKDSGFYQVAYKKGREITKKKFDIVIGSGRKGQSYLSWSGNRLVQLPITWFTPAAQWSNSPGYSPRRIIFNRPITSRCLECHSTFIQTVSDSSKFEEFDHNKIIYAVGCEKCHGPAARHVEFQRKNPDVRDGKYIVNPARLTRERLLDVCSLCHGGSLAKTKPSFSFQPGDTLANYFSLQTAMLNADNIDVHGNQFGLLALSKCFTMSQLSCITCHNVHENENGKIEVFSQRCSGCHNESHEKKCKMTNEIGSVITKNCIDCHMPKQLSHAVSVYLQGESSPTSALMRTHYIKIYPDETKKVLSLLKQTQATRNNTGQQ